MTKKEYAPHLVAIATRIPEDEDDEIIEEYDTVQVFWNPKIWSFTDKNGEIIFEQDETLPQSVRAEKIEIWISSVFAYDSYEWKIEFVDAPDWGIVFNRKVIA